MRSTLRWVLLAVLVLPATSEARSLKVDVPSSVKAGTPFAVSWQGETGPQDATVFGGFIVDAFLRSGSGRCPADRGSVAKQRRVATLGGQNIALAGAFRGANQLVVPKPGRYRLCGYLSKAGPGSITYERFVDRGNIRVRAKSGPSRLVPKPRDGTYTARKSRVIGGGDNASVTIVVAGGVVQSVSAVSVRMSRCEDSVTPSVQPLDTFNDFASTGPASGLGSKLTSARIATALPGGAPDGSISVDGGFRNSRELRAVVTVKDPSGVCRGSVAITARR